MKNRIGKHGIVLPLVLILVLLVGCVPAAISAEPSLPLPTASETAQPSTPTFTQTETLTSTASPTATQTPTLTATLTLEPSATQPFILPSATVRPTRTRTTHGKDTKTPTRLPTETYTATMEVTVTETASATATRCPMATAEPLWVDPVTSPTDQLSQIITVRIGNGEEVTIVTESGTFTATGNFNAYASPALVEVTLLPNTVHHLQVFAMVKTVFSNGCPYGGYRLNTTRDRNGDPLTIVQGTPVP